MADAHRLVQWCFPQGATLRSHRLAATTSRLARANGACGCVEALASVAVGRFVARGNRRMYTLMLVPSRVEVVELVASGATEGVRACAGECTVWVPAVVAQRSGRFVSARLADFV